MSDAFKPLLSRLADGATLSEEQLEQMIGKLEGLVVFEHAAEPGYTPTQEELGSLGKHPGAAAVLEYWKGRRASTNQTLLTMLKVRPGLPRLAQRAAAGTARRPY